MIIFQLYIICLNITGIGSHMKIFLRNLIYPPNSNFEAVEIHVDINIEQYKRTNLITF